MGKEARSQKQSRHKQKVDRYNQLRTICSLFRSMTGGKVTWDESGLTVDAMEHQAKQLIAEVNQQQGSKYVLSDLLRVEKPKVGNRKPKQNQKQKQKPKVAKKTKQPLYGDGGLPPQAYRAGYRAKKGRKKGQRWGMKRQNVGRSGPSQYCK